MPTKEKKDKIILQGVFDDALPKILKKREAKEVFILEGRPSLEAAMENSKSLSKKNIKPILITDNMAGFLFFKNWVREVWVAYQSIQEDGALCDIGALILGVLAKRHKVPLHLFPAKRDTDLLGEQEELTHFWGKRIAPIGIKAYVPLIEFLPNEYIDRIYPRS